MLPGPQEPAQTAKRREVVEPGQIGLTLVGWHVPAAREKDTYALQVAALLLGAGESSRLKLRLKTTDPKTTIGSAVININAKNPLYLGKLGKGRVDILSAVQ